MAMQALARWRGGGAAVVLLGVLLLALLTTENALPADVEGKAAALPADLAKIPSDGMLIISARVADLWGSELAKPVREKFGEEPIKEFQERFGLAPDQVERMTMLMIAPAPPREETALFIRTVKPYDPAKVVATVKNVKAKKYKGEMLYVGDKDWTIYPLDNQSLVYGELREVQALIDRPQPKGEGNLTLALRHAAGKHGLVVGLNVRHFKDRIGNRLPEEIEPFAPLLQALSATVHMDFAADSRAAAVLTFPSDKDAKDALKPADAGLVLLRAGLGRALSQLSKQEDKEAKEVVQLVKQLQHPLKEMRIEQKDETLRTSFALKIDGGAAGLTVVQAVKKMRESAGRTQSMNNLKQLTLAMVNYADSMRGQLPAHAVYSKDGKPLLSWRVTILPFIEQQGLYNAFHLNEPWDSEHNKKLLAKMPRVYAHPQDEKTLQEHTTYYQGFFGKQAFFDGKQGLRYPAAFTDGTSNTIMIAEASRAVPWSKPEDIPFDPEKPLPKLGLADLSYFLAAMCDGSVRAVSHKITKETLRNAITRDGGEVLGADW